MSLNSKRRRFRNIQHQDLTHALIIHRLFRKEVDQIGVQAIVRVHCKETLLENQPFLPGQIIEAIDERLAKVIADRYQITGESGSLPDEAHVERWGRELGIDSTVLRRVFWSLGMATMLPQAMFARRSEIPEAVLPIMQSTTWQTFHLTVTHAVQYPDSSLVSTVLVDRGAGQQPLVANIQLLIESPGVAYSVQQEHTSGQPPRLEQAWRVEPRIPDTVEDIRFMLVPGSEQQPHFKPKQITLDGPLPIEPNRSKA